MEDVDLSQDWVSLLGHLDRQVSSGRLSPDTAALSELMDIYQVPGVSIAVGHVSGAVWAAGYGVTDGETSTPVTAGTAFAACSISKHVAAFGALLLVQDGVLELDADVDEYLTSWHLRDRAGQKPAVTVRQLLAHTAGLSDTWYRGYAEGRTPSLLQLLEGSGSTNTPPVRSTLLPGSRFRYSGSHYSVLQQLLVDVTGTPFEALLRSLVLEPVPMVDSSFDQRFPHQQSRPVARGHHGGGTGVPGGWRVQPELAAAGLWSTPTDLLRLDLEIARAASGDSKLLGRDLATEMWTPQIPGGAYGLGTELADRPGCRRFGHTGLNVGYTCFSYVWPDSGIAVAAMTNSEDGWELLTSVRAAADRRYATEVTAAPLGDVAGRYALRDDYPIDIAVSDGHLTFSAADQQPVVLLTAPGGLYLHPGLDLEVRFVQSSDQHRILELRQEGVTQTATKQDG
ncbi:beta-lactamase family protein [Micromonospora sp. LAH09]|uniref:serine hydrolase domain-containing protein n=1 Tax=Micromonospora cabrerizensis TaxID=2911213 RepID=UPI001EE8BCD9|nr:serine hydrolase domain-containing protein [Micromonospora cabrerizensis]MCG5469560.1 beta-lactamase family protein [Micromonospora cabrerizensis]